MSSKLVDFLYQRGGFESDKISSAYLHYLQNLVVLQVFRPIFSWVFVSSTVLPDFIPLQMRKILMEQRMVFKPPHASNRCAKT